MLSFNARSIATKQAELKDFVSTHDCDIVCITETWLDNNIRFNAFGNKYNVFRQDRKDSRGGGVLLATKCHLQAKLVNSFSVNNCECVLVDVLVKKSIYMRYAVVYRPPNTSRENSIALYDKLFTHLGKCKYFTILGDCNHPDINWEDLTCTSEMGREFLTFCYKIGATQLVDFPTRLNNMIDLILCSDRNLVQCVRSCAPFSTSDHNCIYMEMTSHSVTNKQTAVKACFAKADYNLINAFLATLDWDEIYSDCRTTEEYWCAFKGIMDTVILNFVPFTVALPNDNVPWFTPNLTRL